MSLMNFLRLYRKNAMGATTQEMRSKKIIIRRVPRQPLEIRNIQMRIKVRFSTKRAQRDTVRKQ